MSEKIIKTVSVSGGDYSYATWEGEAWPLMLVHGITASHMAWPRFVRAFGHAHRLFAPDLRGRGANAKLPPPYGFQQHIDDVMTVMDANQLEQSIWVGHSLGAYIGLEFAYQHPDRIKALVLVDGGIALPLPADKKPEEVIKGILGPALARLEKTFESRAAYYDFWQNHPAFQDAEAWNEDVKAYVDYDLTGDPPNMRSVVNAAAVEKDSYGPMAPSMVTRIDEVAVPTLLLTAPRGLLNQAKPLLPNEAVRQAAARNSHVTAKEVADTNHYSILTGSGAAPMAESIKAFLARLP
ncbi:MAG: alpha/beta hydrolase [Pseudomonadota bacterium]